MGSCAAPSAKGDDKFITTDYLQQCPPNSIQPTRQPRRKLRGGPRLRAAEHPPGFALRAG
ncbi:hypothetical protein DN603_31245 [Raoultella planticola]|uniref:DNA replication protein n=1 Tax=Raoultella planticola TaxID=575 RepID=A0A443VCW3_RAOPL|nr:hypothetical protein DN603_31245 [Raoultella planticola]